MAQVDTQNNPNDPNNPNNPANPVNQPAGQQANQPATTGGAGAVTATGAGNVTGQVVGTANPSQPFQNIASYLAANAPQSQQLAGQVAGTVSAPITQANTDITNAANTFTGAVNAGYTPQNTPGVTQALSDVQAGGVTPADVTTFQSQLNDTYTGPTDFTQATGFSNLETEIANAQAQGQNAQTPTGIQTLLQNVETPNYTQGINSLDSILLNENPANAATIAAAGAPAAALSGDLTSITAAENAAAAQAAAQASSAASGAGTALNTAATGVAAPVEAAYNTALTGTENYNQTLSDIINAVGTGNLGNLTPDEQSKIGFNPQILTALSEYPQVFPTVSQANPPAVGTYYSGPQAAILPSSAAQMETPQQAAAIAMLQQLNGGNPVAPLAGLSPNAPAAPYAVPTNFGTYNNTALADAMYNALEPSYLQYEQIPVGTPTLGNDPTTINNLMTLLSQLTNQSLPQPSPIQPGGGGPPYGV